MNRVASKANVCQPAARLLTLALLLTAGLMVNAASPGMLVAWGYNGQGETTIPAGLSGVTAIAAGDFHNVALKTDGTAGAWGWNNYGQTTVPVGLSGVAAISAGNAHTVVLKSNGTVVAWGWNGQGQTTIPAGLSGVAAIAAGDVHTVALKSDGTVVAWGYNGDGRTTIPAGLSGVAAIAAGGLHTVVLKSNGTVVAWGNNGQGQTTVPAGLSGVAAIAAGGYHTVVLKINGTLVAWGAGGPGQSGGENYGQTTIPAGLSGVTAIAAGGYHTLATVPVVLPGITAEPGNQNVNVGQSASFSVVATGSAPLAYKWLKSGVNVAGATIATLTLNNVQTNQSGDYAVVVANVGGSVTSSVARLTVNQLSQTITFGALATRVDDASFALSATASSGLPVSYTSSNPLVAMVSGNTVTITGIGNTTLTASQAGNGTYLPAVDVSQMLAVGAPPDITAQPVSQTVTEGQGMTFAVAATGTLLSFQWRKDGTNISGTTSASFMLSPVQLGDAGIYSVIVSNELGVVISSNARLAVVSFGAPVVRADGEIVVVSITREAMTTLTLETAFPQGYIFYTLDGSTPTISSLLYAGPITVSNTVVVRALALSSDFSQSAEAPAVTIFILPYTVSVTSGGAGVAAVSPAQSYYASNSLVTLTATPDGGWSFLRWEGDASGSSNPLGVTVNRSLQVQAVFGTSLLTNVVGSGRIEITPGGPVPYGSTVELRAVPGAGQKFVAWGSAVSGTNNPRLFTVTQPGPTVAALFAAGPAGLPVITNQPSPRVVSAGGSFTLSVGAGGTGPLRYQWRRNGAALAGATNATLEISGASGAQAGGYDVVVTGPGGTVVSGRASVLVTVFDVRPVVSLLGAAGTGFRVDYADDLDGGPWLLLTNGVLSAERQEVIDFTSTNRARRFYRTVIEP